MSNNIYNILGKLKGITDNAALTPETEATTVYESVDARGSITEAVKSLEAKYQTFKEDKDNYKCILPDGSNDVLFTGTKAECEAWASKGDKDVKIVKEAKTAKPDFLDVDKDGDKAEPFKKAVKDKNNAKGAFKDMFGGSAKDLTSKLKIKEGQGPYELYNPKHPKFKANYDKYKAEHPDCTLAEFIEAMKKREHGLNESQAVVIGGKEVDLNSLEFENIHQWDAPDYSDAYCVAASFVDGTPLSEGEINELESKYGAEVHTAIHNSLHEAAYDEPEAPNADAVAKRKRLQAIKDRQEDERTMGGKDDTNTPIRKVAGKAYGGAAQKDDVSDLDEGIKFGDKIANNSAVMKKAKLAKIKEGRVMEETDYFYEQVAKALCEKNPNLNTADGEFEMAVRKEMVAQGIQPNRARNILLIDEDFLSDVATSYGHYCKEVAESSNFFHNPNVPDHKQLPAPPEEVNVELDEIAALAGLPAPMQEADLQQEIGLERSSLEELDESSINEAASRKDFRMVADLIKNIPDEAKRKELAQHHADIFKQQNPRFSHDKFYAAAGVVNEADMSEGNEFSGALAAAKASGAKEFEVAGKRYTVKEDINVNITANGQEDALNLFRKLAGMDEVTAQPVIQAVDVTELPQDAASAIAQGVVDAVDEERDPEYVNSPREQTAGIDAAIPSGNDLHATKRAYKIAQPGDNPMAVAEAKDTSWSKYTSLLKGLLK